MGGELLEVVEHEEHPAFAHDVDGVIERVATIGGINADAMSEARAELTRHAQVFERDERHAAGKRSFKFVDRSLCQPSFADAAGTDERQ